MNLYKHALEFTNEYGENVYILYKDITAIKECKPHSAREQADDPSYSLRYSFSNGIEFQNFKNDTELRNIYNLVKNGLEIFHNYENII